MWWNYPVRLATAVLSGLLLATYVREGVAKQERTSRLGGVRGRFARGKIDDDEYEQRRKYLTDSDVATTDLQKGHGQKACPRRCDPLAGLGLRRLGGWRCGEVGQQLVVEPVLGTARIPTGRPQPASSLPAVLRALVHPESSATRPPAPSAHPPSPAIDAPLVVRESGARPRDRDTRTGNSENRANDAVLGSTGATEPSVILVREVVDRQPEELSQLLVGCTEQLEAQLTAGAMVALTGSGARIRLLPLL